LIHVIRDETAPQAVVGEGFGPDRLQFEGEGVCIGRRWIGVERHLDHGGDAAGRGGRAPCLEPFPVCAARLVEVHVRIDAAGKHEPPGRIQHLLRRWRYFRGQNRRDATTGDQQGAREHAGAAACRGET
jgi:hypothetical protein